MTILFLLLEKARCGHLLSYLERQGVVIFSLVLLFSSLLSSRVFSRGSLPLFREKQGVVILFLLLERQRVALLSLLLEGAEGGPPLLDSGEARGDHPDPSSRGVEVAILSLN